MVGLTICYDLRFPELYRILALRGARVITVPAAFTERTGRDHWEVLIRARAIENQVFVVAAGQIGFAPPALPELRPLDDRRPLGRGRWRRPPDTECFVSADLDFTIQNEMRDSLPSLRHRRPEAYRWPENGQRTACRPRPRAGRREGSVVMAQAPAPDKRRAILDAAITVFARQGFHSARVSDVAAEAGVAYGLVYHYFDSKDQMLNELFSRALGAAGRGEPRGRGRAMRRPGTSSPAVANFIIESYRHEPELMKVIIVEVTRAANSFGRTHLPEIRQAYDLVAEIVSDAQGPASSATTSTRTSPRWSSTGRSSSCSPAGSSARCRAADEDYRARQAAWSSRRSARGSSRGRSATRWPARAHMWEGLARTERQDRVLHGAAKLANVLIGILLLPLWLFGQLIGGRVRDFLRGLERRGRRHAARPARARAHMDALMSDLRWSREPARSHSDFAEARRGFADISNFVVAQHREGAVLGYRYPGQFQDHIVEGADGERIAATIALQEAARPGLIVVHGLFTSSRFDYVRQIAVRAFYEWGFNVAALDLRSFGMTELTSPAPSTAGWKEGLDILALARYMKELGATSVGALGHLARRQLGARTPHDAEGPTDRARRRDPRGLPAGGDPKIAWERLSEPVPRGHPRYPLHRAFEAALISRVRSGPLAAGGGGHAARDGATSRRLTTASTAERDLDPGPRHRPRGRRQGAAAVLHPEDDPIVKVEHARMLAAGRQRQRPGPGLDPARRLARPARGGRSALDPRRLPDLLRALGDLRRAQRPAGQRAGRRIGLLLAESPGSASHGRGEANGQRNLEATDLGGLAGGHRRAGDRRRAPALRGDLAPRLQRGATRVTDGEGTQPQEPAASPPPSRLRAATARPRQRRQGPEDMTVGELVFEVSDRPRSWSARRSSSPRPRSPRSSTAFCAARWRGWSAGSSSCWPWRCDARLRLAPQRPRLQQPLGRLLRRGRRSSC